MADLGSDLGDNKAVVGAGGFLGGVPSSFQTQMAFATGAMRGGGGKGGEGDEGRLARLMLARMTTLEEGMRDIVKEVRGMTRGGGKGGKGKEKERKGGKAIEKVEGEWRDEEEKVEGVGLGKGSSVGG